MPSLITIGGSASRITAHLEMKGLKVQAPTATTHLSKGNLNDDHSLLPPFPKSVLPAAQQNGHKKDGLGQIGGHLGPVGFPQGLPASGM